MLLILGCTLISSEEVDAKFASDPVPLAIDTLTPDYATTTGGVEVTIEGGPFDGDATVWFGDEEATVRDRSRTALVVEAPAQAGEGRVDITVHTATGDGSAPAAFAYYTDATGKKGIFGSMEWTRIVGQYWGEVENYGNLSFLFLTPEEFEYWNFYAPALGRCASNHEFGTDLFLLDVGLEEADVVGPSGETFGLELDASTGWYTTETPDEAEFIAGSLDLSPLSPPELPAFGVEDLSRYPEPISVTTPDIAGDAPPTVQRSAFDLAWEPGDGDAILVRLIIYEEGGSGVLEQVTCAVEDDGAFTIPSAVWDHWSPGVYMYMVVGRMATGTGTLPFNNAGSAMVGIDWVYGAALME